MGEGWGNRVAVQEVLAHDGEARGARLRAALRLREPRCETVVTRVAHGKPVSTDRLASASA